MYTDIQEPMLNATQEQVLGYFFLSNFMYLEYLDWILFLFVLNGDER